MSREVLLLTRHPGGGTPIPWLFETEGQAEEALQLFRDAGIYPSTIQDNLWNDVAEVREYLQQLGAAGATNRMRRLNQEGNEWYVEWKP